VEGSAFERLTALEDVDQAGGVVKLQNLDTNTTVEVVLEEIQFRQTAPPDGFGHFGGIITVIARTV
jgi:hypothetical protein